MRIDGSRIFSSISSTSENVESARTSNAQNNIFTDSKLNKPTKKNDKNLNEQQVLMKIANEQVKLVGKYSVSNHYTKAENIEKAMHNSKVPNLSSVSSYAKLEIKSISDDINNMLGTIPDKCANYKTEDEIKSVIKDIETEIMQKNIQLMCYCSELKKLKN